MDGIEILGVVNVVLVLIIVALILVVFYQNRQTGASYPADVKQILGALAGLAVYFATRTPNTVDDAAVNNVLVPLFKLLGVDVPVMVQPTPPPAQPVQPPAQTPPTPESPANG